MNVLGKLLVSTLVLLSFTVAACAGTVEDPEIKAKLAAIDTLRVYAESVEAYLAKPQPAQQTLIESTDIATRRALSQAAISATPPPKGIDSGVRAKSEPFVCTNAIPQSCDEQALVHKFKSRDTHPIYYTRGKYKVGVYYKNDKKYPTKYIDDERYAGLSQYETDQLNQQIIEHFLGEGYEAYAPEVHVSTRRNVGLNIYVTSPDELERFVKDETVISIFHGGNSEVEELVGGGLMPRRSTIDGSIIKETK